MRALIFLLVLVPQFLFAQTDTIRISELDQTRHSAPDIQFFLLINSYHPINFMYSNVFEYRKQPFTGVAKEKAGGYRYLILQLESGRIIHLKEYDERDNKLLYRFDRVAQDSIVAIDSTFNGSSLTPFQSTGLIYKKGADLRFESHDVNGSVWRGYYEKCIIGKSCTDDGYAITETPDGINVKRNYSGFTETVYKDGTIINPVRFYTADTVLRAEYCLDKNGESEGLLNNTGRIQK